MVPVPNWMATGWVGICLIGFSARCQGSVMTSQLLDSEKFTGLSQRQATGLLIKMNLITRFDSVIPSHMLSATVVRGRGMFSSNY